MTRSSVIPTARGMAAHVVAAALALAAAMAAAAAPHSLTAQERPREAAAPPTIEEKTAAMERMDGFFPIYWEETAGRIWLEIGLWDTDVLHAAGIGAGLGSNDIGIDRGQQSGSRVVRFHGVGPKVLMIQPNYRFRASSDNPSERKAVEDAFAPSTLWGSTVAAATGTGCWWTIPRSSCRTSPGSRGGCVPGPTGWMRAAARCTCRW